MSGKFHHRTDASVGSLLCTQSLQVQKALPPLHFASDKMGTQGMRRASTLLWHSRLKYVMWRNYFAPIRGDLCGGCKRLLFNKLLPEPFYLKKHLHFYEFLPPTFVVLYLYLSILFKTHNTSKDLNACRLIIINATYVKMLLNIKAYNISYWWLFPIIGGNIRQYSNVIAINRLWRGPSMSRAPVLRLNFRRRTILVAFNFEVYC